MIEALSKCTLDECRTAGSSLHGKEASGLACDRRFRDPIRPTYCDLSYFFSPADGIILYQRTLHPDQCLVEIKGRSYSLRDALRDPAYEAERLVIGIFMTFYDVHTNRKMLGTAYVTAIPLGWPLGGFGSHCQFLGRFASSSLIGG